MYLIILTVFFIMEVKRDVARNMEIWDYGASRILEESEKNSYFEESAGEVSDENILISSSDVEEPYHWPMNVPHSYIDEDLRESGIVFDDAAGEQIFAAADGTVAVIQPHDVYGEQILVLRHPENFHTVYIGVLDILVSKGDRVLKGEVIARLSVESTSGIHFQVRDGLNGVDPLSFLEER